MGQCADDSTLMGSSLQDYYKYKEALKLFEHASGMRINWEKSFIIWLGPFSHQPPPLEPTDKIKQLNLNYTLRVLGVDLGHVQDQHQGWRKLKDTLYRTINSGMNKCGNQIGDTISINAMIGGACIHIANFLTLLQKERGRIQTWMGAFVRESCYMMSNRKRSSSEKHGTLVTLVNMDHNITTLIAKWAFKILSNTTQPTYNSMWYYELQHMSNHLGYKCVDHFLNSTHLHSCALSRAKPHKLKFNLFTLQC